MFPGFQTGQQLQQQQPEQAKQSHSQTSIFNQSPNSTETLSTSPPISSNLGAFVNPFQSSPTPLPNMSSGSLKLSEPSSTPITFAFTPSFSNSASGSIAVQPASAFQMSSIPNLTMPDQKSGNEPPKSVFADFLKPAIGKSEPFSGSRPSVQVACTFFQKGSCRNGDTCPYLHEAQSSSSDAAEHPFVNPLSVSDYRSKVLVNNNEQRSKSICRYFLAGACLKGESCKFSHETKGPVLGDRPPTLPSSSVAETNNQNASAVLSTEGLFTRRLSPTHASAEGIFTKKLSPPHPANLPLNLVSSGVHPDKHVELNTSLSPKESVEAELAAEDLLTARSRRFRGRVSFLPEAPTPLVAAMDDLVEEEEPEFASGSACIVGTLMTMCSEEEIRKRDLEMDVHILESIQDETAKSRSVRRADPEKMVKKYQRSAAGMGVAIPSEVRPPVVLAKTVDYLFNSVLDSTLAPPLDVYNFLRDRFRAIRKDFALQDQAETLAATVHEQIARYFILSHHELCEEKEDDFQKFQNIQQISHTITSLNHYYKDLRIKNGVATPSEAEFYSYQILLNMRDANKLNDCLMNLPVHIRAAPLICVARELVASFRVLNYAGFFRVLKTRATYLQRCCVHGFLFGFRSRSIKIIYNGMGPIQSTFPLQSLIDILAFDDLNEAIHFCKLHGITISNNEIVKTASPIEEEVRIEWMKSHVLIGPPKPSRKAVILCDQDASVAANAQQICAESEAQQQEQKLKFEKEEQEKKRLQDEIRMKEFAAKEEALRVHLNELDSFCVQFESNSSRRKKTLVFRNWHILAISIRNRRLEEKRRKQLQLAQQKFSEQKAYLLALSKVARLFLTHIWLNRWRLRCWNRRRADQIASLFVLYIWFRKWNRETCRVRQFKLLVRSKPPISRLPPVRQVIMPSESSRSLSFVDILMHRINRNVIRVRSDLHIRIAISVPALRYSDAVQNKLYSDFKVCNSVLKILSVNEKPVNNIKGVLDGGCNIEIRITRTSGAILDRPVHGVFFLVPSNDFRFSSQSEVTRYRTLLELEPDTHIVALYPSDSPDQDFEESFRSRLPSFLRQRIVMVNISSERAIVGHLAQNLGLCISNKLDAKCSSPVLLDEVIRLRSREIISLGLDPDASIFVFNQAMDDISRSILSESSDANEQGRANEARAIILSHALPEMLPLEARLDQENLAKLVTYVRQAFHGLVASEPIVSRMSLAAAEGANTVGLVSIVINRRMDSLLLKLVARGLSNLLCCNTPALSVEKHKCQLPETCSSNEIIGDNTLIESPTKAKKRSRDSPASSSIRDWKRKLLGQNEPSFSKRIDELLAQICR